MQLTQVLKQHKSIFLGPYFAIKTIDNDLGEKFRLTQKNFIIFFHNYV